MRERLVAAFVGLTVVVIALFGIPRAYVLADLVRTQEQARVDRTADLVALVLDRRVATHVPISTAYLDSLADKGERIVLVPASGPRVASTAPAPAPGDVSATRQVPSGGRVTVSRTEDAVSAGISHAVLPLLLLGLLLIAVAALAGFVLARRLARPFQELAVAAQSFGLGRFRPAIPAYRVPEAQQIGHALEVAGQQLDGQLRRERELAARASHELRTPVTALRLELEDLALWPETPEPVRTQLQSSVAQLDRLSSAIGDVLAIAEGRRLDAEIDLDLDALVADTVARLRDVERVSVRHEPAGRLPTRLEPRAVIAILELLIAEVRRAGEAEVRVQDLARETHFEVRLASDDLRGPSPDAGARQRWDVAVEMAASVGGQLAWGSDPDPAIVLRLPKHALAGGTAPPE